MAPVLAQGATAPPRSDSVRSGTTRPGSNRISVPRPSHFEQAPKGLLNENRRGSISSMVKPDTGQANFCEKMIRSWVSFFDLLALSSDGGRRRQRPVGELGHRDAIGELERRLEAVGHAGSNFGPDDDPVDYHVDVVLELLVEHGRIIDLVESTVHLDALEAFLLQVGDLLAVFAFAPAHDGRQKIEPRSFLELQHPVDHLGHRLGLDRKPGGRRIGDADAGEEQAQIIVDFGDRAHGGARVA